MKNNLNNLALIVIVLFLSVLIGCKVYSFSGAAIPSDIKTISIQTINNKTNRAPNSIERIITEQIRQKLAAETGLTLVQSGGDFEISGNVAEYLIDPVAATDGSLSNKYRLTIIADISFVNNKYPKESWNQRFSQFSIYENEKFSSLEESLIIDNSKRIAQDIFNKALGNW